MKKLFLALVVLLGVQLQIMGSNLPRTQDILNKRAVNIEFQQEQQDKESRKNVKNISEQLQSQTISEKHMTLFGKHSPAEMISILGDRKPVGEDQKIIAVAEKALQREKEFFQDYYVFYHGGNSDLGFVFKIYTMFENLVNEQIHTKDFSWFRPKKEVSQQFITQDQFIDYWEKEIFKDGHWDDSLGCIKKDLLSVNLTLFGNNSRWSNSSFSMFLRKKSVDAKIIQKLKLFTESIGLLESKIDKLNSIWKKYYGSSKGGVLYQIFIPKTKVNDFVYLSHSFGTPYRCKLVGSFDEAKKRHPRISDVLDAYLMGTVLEIDLKNIIVCKDEKCMRENQDKIVIFGLSFKNKPHHLENKFDGLLDQLQVRIVLLSEFFNPEIGVKIFEYRLNELTKEAKDNFQKEFNEEFNLMMADWIDNGGLNRVTSDRAHSLRRLNEFVKEDVPCKDTGIAWQRQSGHWIEKSEASENFVRGPILEKKEIERPVELDDKAKIRQETLKQEWELFLQEHGPYPVSLEGSEKSKKMKEDFKKWKEDFVQTLKSMEEMMPLEEKRPSFKRGLDESDLEKIDWDEVDKKAAEASIKKRKTGE
ncbi:MAG: hypothetical protein UR26_C0006G0050 [candidate division TM6 bacterium GW2011_GWF2_32_72]|nr:MAG: hypothetical protein UR26_C0006G0050 [candidate division TM6 bacterium GW2011_GWF2_32_72]